MRTRIFPALLTCVALSCAAFAQTSTSFMNFTSTLPAGTAGTFKEDIQRPANNNVTSDIVGAITINVKNGTFGDSQIVLSSSGITPGLPPHTTYAIQFCVIFDSPEQCHAVTSVTTDASGNARKNFTFPIKGTFAGVFFFSRKNFPNELLSAFQQDSPDSFYNAHLHRIRAFGYSRFNNQIGPQGTDPLKNGTIVHHDFSFFRVTLAGAKPSTTYTIQFCTYGSEGGCPFLGSVRTDHSGNGHSDVRFGNGQTRNRTFQNGAFILSRTNAQGGTTEYLSGFFVKR